MRKSIITSHIDKVVERSDGNLIIVIRKFGWIGCLPRSVWGIIAILSIVATVVLSVKRMPLRGVLGLASILLWVSAWVDANDRLKKNIFPDVLEMHLLKTGKLTAPFAIKHFHPQQDLIECVTDRGEKQSFRVEVVEERLPLYAVKIHIRPNARR